MNPAPAPPGDTPALPGALRAAAQQLGFEACHIADATLPIDPEDRLGQWLDAGYHADMAWMASTKAQRQDIRQMLPGAESVVVLAHSYYRPTAESRPGTGRVARYAHGRDYHKVLKKKLQRLARWLEEAHPGTATWTCVDSAPALERSWAARSGLGWVGKNSLVLRRDLGSYFFLGLIATTLRLPPDVPELDHCGSCTACLEACPTQAFPRPGVLDSNRCISYHTIENRGAIPEELARRFGDWIFGCDICQEVCPWNRFAQPTDEPDFAARPEVAAPDLRELLAMPRAAYETRFAGTPVRRAKYEGLQRNARIALENAARAETAP